MTKLGRSEFVRTTAMALASVALSFGATRSFQFRIEFIVETIEYINSKTRTKQYDNISIGTDFDGLADAPKDLYKPSQLDKLIKALGDHKISPDNIKKITSGNALRLLRYGWGNPT
jgi:microsomal dipeptidase-like Zn-dependent dipeptidase